MGGGEKHEAEESRPVAGPETAGNAGSSMPAPVADRIVLSAPSTSVSNITTRLVNALQMPVVMLKRVQWPISSNPRCVEVLISFRCDLILLYIRLIYYSMT